jgi:hypothetical protein
MTRHTEKHLKIEIGGHIRLSAVLENDETNQEIKN